MQDEREIAALAVQLDANEKILGLVKSWDKLLEREANREYAREFYDEYQADYRKLSRIEMGSKLNLVDRFFRKPRLVKRIESNLEKIEITVGKSGDDALAMFDIDYEPPKLSKLQEGFRLCSKIIKQVKEDSERLKGEMEKLGGGF